MALKSGRNNKIKQKIMLENSKPDHFEKFNQKSILKTKKKKKFRKNFFKKRTQKPSQTTLAIEFCTDCYEKLLLQNMTYLSFSADRKKKFLMDLLKKNGNDDDDSDGFESDSSDSSFFPQTFQSSSIERSKLVPKQKKIPRKRYISSDSLPSEMESDSGDENNKNKKKVFKNNNRIKKNKISNMEAKKKTQDCLFQLKDRNLPVEEYNPQDNFACDVRHIVDQENKKTKNIYKNDSFYKVKSGENTYDGEAKKYDKSLVNYDASISRVNINEESVENSKNNKEIGKKISQKKNAETGKKSMKLNVPQTNNESDISTHNVGAADGAVNFHGNMADFSGFKPKETKQKDCIMNVSQTKMNLTGQGIDSSEVKISKFFKLNNNNKNIDNIDNNINNDINNNNNNNINNDMNNNNNNNINNDINNNNNNNINNDINNNNNKNINNDINNNNNNNINNDMNNNKNSYTSIDNNKNSKTYINNTNNSHVSKIDINELSREENPDINNNTNDSNLSTYAKNTNENHVDIYTFSEEKDASEVDVFEKVDAFIAALNHEDGEDMFTEFQQKFNHSDDEILEGNDGKSGSYENELIDGYDGGKVAGEGVYGLSNVVSTGVPEEMNLSSLNEFEKNISSNNNNLNNNNLNNDKVNNNSLNNNNSKYNSVNDNSCKFPADSNVKTDGLATNNDCMMDLIMENDRNNERNNDGKGVEKDVTESAERSINSSSSSGSSSSSCDSSDSSSVCSKDYNVDEINKEVVNDGEKKNEQNFDVKTTKKRDEKLGVDENLDKRVNDKEGLYGYLWDSLNKNVENMTNLYSPKKLNPIEKPKKENVTKKNVNDDWSYEYDNNRNAESAFGFIFPPEASVNQKNEQKVEQNEIKKDKNSNEKKQPEHNLLDEKRNKIVKLTFNKTSAKVGSVKPAFRKDFDDQDNNKTSGVFGDEDKTKNIRKNNSKNNYHLTSALQLRSTHDSPKTPLREIEKERKNKSKSRSPSKRRKSSERYRSDSSEERRKRCKDKYNCGSRSRDYSEHHSIPHKASSNQHYDQGRQYDFNSSQRSKVVKNQKFYGKSDKKRSVKSSGPYNFNESRWGALYS